MTTDNDRVILEILDSYFKDHPGNPKMSLADFKSKLAAKGIELADATLFSRLHKQKGHEWIDFQLTEGAQAGHVWIRSQGQAALSPDAGSSNQRTDGPTTRQQLVENAEHLDRLRAREIAEIKSCFKQASEGHHFVVLGGQRMVGKSRLLARLCEDLSDEYVPLLIETPITSDLNGFAYDLARQLTNKFQIWASKHSVSTLSSPHKKAFKDGGKEAFLEHWTGLRQGMGEKRPVVMIDHIENLGDPGRLNDKIIKFIDDFVRDPRNGNFILAVCDLPRENLLHRLLAKGYPVRIRHHKEEKIRPLLSHRIADSMSNEVINFCLALCDGHPRFLETVLNLLAKIQEWNQEDFISEFLQEVHYFLCDLTHRMSSHELTVVWLTGQRILAAHLELEYSLQDLKGMADQYESTRNVTEDVLLRGVCDLAERELIEWKNWNAGLFRFRLAALPLWARRRAFFLGEEHQWK
ncbi:MAG: ATP-binding protein [Chloroflexota bacterium]